MFKTTAAIPFFLALTSGFVSMTAAAQSSKKPLLKPASAGSTLSEKEYTVSDAIRVRCATDSSETFYEWRGSVFSFVPGEKQKPLFKVIGMNVSRCKPGAAGSWLVLSREIQLYLDPKTGEPLQKWENPWTHELLPVIHVANNPVQNRYPNIPYRAGIAGNDTVFNEDWPLTYPNPLAGDAQFAEYGNGSLYQASEMFKYLASTSELEDPKSTKVNSVKISWTRTGPWLPWMKMKNTPGYLVYSAWGGRIDSYAALSPLLRNEIDARLPLYQNAPSCWLATKNETSWTYFMRHFEAYRRGERFPIAAPKTPDQCGDEPK